MPAPVAAGPVYSARLTADERAGRAAGPGGPAALQAEARLAAMAAELSGKIATAVLARSGRDAMYFAETGRLDWGNVGDMQLVLARLIDAARPLGIDGLPEEGAS